MIFAMLGIAKGQMVVAAASQPHLTAGDQLVYQITAELQRHHTTAGATAKDITSESAVQGSETFNIYAVGSDGTAFANVDASFQGASSGKPFESHSTCAAKITPDGSLLVNAKLGLGISDAVGFANTTTSDVAGRMLHVGETWTAPHDTPYVRLTMVRRVVGVKTYQGFRAFEIQSLGSGELLRTADGEPASGTVTISGTSYYDATARLFVGEALRTLTVVKPPRNSPMHDDYSASMNVMLSALNHPTPVPAPPTSAPAESATPAQAASPAEVSPSPGSEASPVPTVTPRTGT